MKGKCHFCPASTSPESGYVDIGGLELCVECYATRSTRTEMPCEVCGKAVQITPNPLLTAQICGECDSKADLSGAWNRAKNRSPCDKCGKVHEKYHHATCYGQNVCHDCYQKHGGCTQCYPGDRGYPVFSEGADYRPSVPAVVLTSAREGFISQLVVPCVVCKNLLGDTCGLSTRFKLPSICQSCTGPVWWDYMRTHYEELSNASSQAKE